jgi:ABC-type glutathione transport system ATPase component
MATVTANGEGLGTHTAIAARAVDATKIYGSGDTEVRALDGVTVDFPVGEFSAIMGPSGSGKSRSCTAWPVSTRSPRAPPSSARTT